VSGEPLNCGIQAVEAADEALTASVRAELTRQGVVVRRLSAADGSHVAVIVSVAPAGPALAAVDRLADRCGRVLVVAGGGATASAMIWQLLAGGASDVLTWRGEQPGAAVLSRLRRWKRIDDTVDAPFVRDQLVGRSRAWLGALRRLVEIASFTTSSLVLAGESGTGKELMARLFHHLDRREGKRDLIVVDCTTVVPTLSGSEFFGHERGAFTGAMTAREGAFAAADKGTLFLDEVGELPLPMQAELLRVIQEGSYKRVGSDSWRSSRFRLVCATNRDLVAELSAGRFRLDLYHRLAANVVQLPPLRERRDDVLPLFTHFLVKEAGTELDLHPAVAEMIQRRDYPGNVRDLRQLASRIAVRHVGPGPVTPGDVPVEERPAAAPTVEPSSDGLFDRAATAALREGRGYREIRDAAGDAAVRLAIAQARGNLQSAARSLSVTDRMLQQRCAVDRGDEHGTATGDASPTGHSRPAAPRTSP
jgi:transcriptional regulator with GAF, ATPase, and Fis domain